MVEITHQQFGIGLRIVVVVRVNNDSSRNQVAKVGSVKEECGDKQPGNNEEYFRLVGGKFVHWG